MFKLFQIQNFNLYHNIEDLNVTWLREINDFRQKTNYIQGDVHTRQHNYAYLEAEITGLANSQTVIEELEQLSNAYGEKYKFQCFAAHEYKKVNFKKEDLPTDNEDYYIYGNYGRIYNLQINSSQQDPLRIKFKLILQTPFWYKLENNLFFNFNRILNSEYSTSIWKFSKQVWGGGTVWNQASLLSNEYTDPSFSKSLKKSIFIANTCCEEDRRFYKNNELNNQGLFLWRDKFFNPLQSLGEFHSQNLQSIPKNSFSLTYTFNSINNGVAAQTFEESPPTQTAPGVFNYSNINLANNSKNEINLVLLRRTNSSLNQTLTGFFNNKNQYIEIYNQTTKTGFRLTYNKQTPSPVLALHTHTGNLFEINPLTGSHININSEILNGNYQLENIGSRQSILDFENMYPVNTALDIVNTNTVRVSGNFTAGINHILIQTLQTFVNY